MVIIELRDAMHKARINQRELATKTGMSISTINLMYNRKTTRMDFESIDKLCKVLDCQPGDIIKRSDKIELSKEDN